jgi:hypothetical protein
MRVGAAEDLGCVCVAGAAVNATVVDKEISRAVIGINSMLRVGSDS